MPLPLGANDPLEGHRGWDKKIKLISPLPIFTPCLAWPASPLHFHPQLLLVPKGCCSGAKIHFVSTRAALLSLAPHAMWPWRTSRAYFIWHQHLEVTMTQNFLRSGASQPAPAKAIHGNGGWLEGENWPSVMPTAAALSASRQCSTGFPLMSVYQTWPGLSLP